MHKLYLLSALALTSACGGTTIESRLDTGGANFTANEIIGREFGGNGHSIRGSQAEEITASAELISSSSMRLTVDGASYSLSNLTGGNRYASVSGFEVATIGTELNGFPQTSDALFIIAADRPTPFLAGDRLSFVVDGNKTSASRLPSGTATYTGGANGVNGIGQTAIGSITLALDFDSDTFDAILTGVNPGDTSASYTTENGTIDAGALQADMTGSGVTGGSITGAVYGAGADQAAGSYSVETANGDFIGFFGATD